MKLALNLFLFLFTFVAFSDQSLSLTYYQIKKICEKEKSQRNCEKNLREKKSLLEKGNFIEIPVIPYKK